MEEADTRKRPAGGEAAEEAKAAKKQRDLESTKKEEEGGQNDDILALLSSEDVDTLSDVLKLLKSVDQDWPVDPTTPPPPPPPTAAADHAKPVRFVDNPYTPQWVFQTAPSSYVTVNGNEESCGSTFSDSDSSLMAYVDVAGFCGAIAVEVLDKGTFWSDFDRWLMEENGGLGGACGGSEAGTSGGGGGLGLAMEVEWDDNVLARFFGEDPYLISESQPEE